MSADVVPLQAYLSQQREIEQLRGQVRALQRHLAEAQAQAQAEGGSASVSASVTLPPTDTDTDTTTATITVIDTATVTDTATATSTTTHEATPKSTGHGHGHGCGQDRAARVEAAGKGSGGACDRVGRFGPGADLDSEGQCLLSGSDGRGECVSSSSSSSSSAVMTETETETESGVAFADDCEHASSVSEGELESRVSVQFVKESFHPLEPPSLFDLDLFRVARGKESTSGLGKNEKMKLSSADESSQRRSSGECIGCCCDLLFYLHSLTCGHIAAVMVMTGIALPPSGPLDALLPVAPPVHSLEQIHRPPLPFAEETNNVIRTRPPVDSDDAHKSYECNDHEEDETEVGNGG
jgi:hypothetical protein